MPTFSVPAGMDLNKYTRPDEMHFSVSGLTKKEHGKIDMPMKVEFPLQNVLYDSVNNVRIMQHIPAPTNRHGAANPQVVRCIKKPATVLLDTMLLCIQC